MGEADLRSKMPWFRIQPGFRTRSEGEAIRMGDTVVLQSMSMPGMYVHTSLSAQPQRQKQSSAEIPKVLNEWLTSFLF